MTHTWHIYKELKFSQKSADLRKENHRFVLAKLDFTSSNDCNCLTLWWWPKGDYSIFISLTPCIFRSNLVWHWWGKSNIYYREGSPMGISIWSSTYLCRVLYCFPMIQCKSPWFQNLSRSHLACTYIHKKDPSYIHVTLSTCKTLKLINMGTISWTVML